MSYQKDLCELLRERPTSLNAADKAADLIEQQAARIAELERSPWRPMSEAPDGDPLCVYAYPPGCRIVWGWGRWSNRRLNAIAYVPIPPYVDEGVSNG